MSVRRGRETHQTVANMIRAEKRAKFDWKITKCVVLTKHKLNLRPGIFLNHINFVYSFLADSNKQKSEFNYRFFCMCYLLLIIISL